MFPKPVYLTLPRKHIYKDPSAQSALVFTLVPSTWASQLCLVLLTTNLFTKNQGDRGASNSQPSAPQADALAD